MSISVYTNDEGVNRFGQSANLMSHPTPQSVEFSKTFDTLMQKAGQRARVSILSLLVPDKDFARQRRVVQRFAEDLIAKALSPSRKPTERSYVFLDELVKSGASAEVIRDQILGLILAGRDTTASAMSALFWHLARRPEIVRKMRDEVKRFDERKPTWEELKNLKYMNYVIKEGELSIFSCPILGPGLPRRPMGDRFY